MTTDFDTVYRVLRPDPSDRELKDLYTPTAAELAFLTTTAKRPTARLALAIHFKVFQYLGYFVHIKDVPERIRQHVAQCLGYKRLPKDDQLEGYDTSGHKRIHMAAVRERLNVRPLVMSRDRAWLVSVARKAAETKHHVGGVVEQLIDELLRQRFELPALDTLKNIAGDARTTVHDAYLQGVVDALSPEARQTIDGLLNRGSDPLTGWNALKREPRKPTNKEARFWLQHIDRLKRLADQMPKLDIPVPKLTYFREWARALDATQLKRLEEPAKSGLAAIFIHAQRGNALDDAVEMYQRLIQRLENLAIRKLEEYRLAHGAEADVLIAQLREILLAHKTPGTKEQRFIAMDGSLAKDVDALLKECEQHLAIRHRNFLPFLVEPYEAVRRLLLNCLEIIDLQALDDDSETRKLIQILRDLRSSRKRLLTFEEVGLEKTELKWLSELWRYHVIQKGEDGNDCLYRVYFELAILFKIRSELKSGDLYVPKGERFDDYRESLVDDETLVKELPDYGATTGINVDAQQHIAKLIEQLKQKIRQVDARFPDNPYAEIVDGRLSLKRPKRSKTSARTSNCSTT